MIVCAAVALVCCGDDGDHAPAPAPPAPRSVTAPASTDSTVAPDWVVRLSTTPVITTFHTTGPVVHDGRVIVGSTAVGVASVDPATGEFIVRDGGSPPAPPRDREPAGAPDSARAIEPVRRSHPRGEVAIDDQRLRVATEVPGRFVHARGALGWTDAESGEIVALRLEPAAGDAARATVRPVWVAFDTGAIVRSGDPVAADGVTSAAIDGAGIVAVARLGRDLRRHQVILWGPDGATRWRWELPAPQQARVDISVGFGADAVYVFYDGRDLARLALESPTPAAGSGDARAPASQNPTP